MNIVFRQATQEDKVAIENLFIEMLQSIFNTEKVTGYQNGYLDKFFCGLDNCIIVAQLNDIIIGYIAIVVNRGEKQYVYIDDFSVKKEYRNLGIGSQLLQQAEEFVKGKDILDILLHVEMTNTSAQNLYKKNGFEILRVDGSRILMKKSL